jgi:putative PIN family toxin of toxin-antitoxin system
VLIVLDTNVLVSGLLSPFGPPARVLDQVLSNTVQVAYDDRILDEYAEVLSRPVFHFEPGDSSALIEHIRLNGLHVSPAPLAPHDWPDQGDVPFAEVAVSASSNALVTGNVRHFKLLRKVPVLTPRELIETLQGLLGGN